MTLKTILVAASGGTASDGAVELACRLARKFEAHVEGLHIRVDPRAVVAIAADGLGAPMVGGWIDQIAAESDELAKKTKEAFDPATNIGLFAERRCLAHGLILRALGDTIAIAPPLIADGATIETILQKLAVALDETLLYAEQNGYV